MGHSCLIARGQCLLAGYPSCLQDPARRRGDRHGCSGSPIHTEACPRGRGRALSSAPGFFGDLVQCSAHGVGWKSSTQDAYRCAVETSMHRSCLQSLRSSVRYLAKSLARFPSPWERPWLSIPSSPTLSLLCSLFCLFPCGLETHDSLTDYVAGSWKSLRPTRILLHLLLPRDAGAVVAFHMYVLIILYPVSQRLGSM